MQILMLLFGLCVGVRVYWGSYGGCVLSRHGHTGLLCDCKHLHLCDKQEVTKRYSRERASDRVAS